VSFNDPKYSTPRTTNDGFGGKYGGGKMISVGNSIIPARGRFVREMKLPRIGKAESRISLRPGLVKFDEGDTIANIENDSHKPLTKDE
jgi:ribosomal protein L27